MPKKTSTDTQHKATGVKTVSPRISESSHAFYATLTGTTNAGAQYVLDAFPMLYMYTLNSLKGQFERRELMLIIDANNDFTLQPGLAGQHMKLQVANGISLRHLDEEHQIDGTELIAKIEGLDRFEVACLELWVKAYWVQDDRGEVSGYVRQLLGELQKDGKRGK
jgi:hypothetical protein